MTKIGFWPDPPSRRMAWDEDGTVALLVKGTLESAIELSSVQKKALNDEDPSSMKAPEVGFGKTSTHYMTFIFPEKRNITHYYAVIQKHYHYSSSSAGVVQWSNDTTNGIDGTWTTVANQWVHNSNNSGGARTPLTSPGFPDSRTELQAFPVAGVKAIRFYFTDSQGQESYIHTFHLYGHKAAGETPHRIDFCYEDGSELVQDFDFGDQPRGSVRTWTPAFTYNIGSGLFLRNRSPDKVAHDVVISLQNLSGDMINRLSLSKDNISFGTQISYTEIQPLQIVGPVYVKHDVPDITSMGLYTSRLKLVVGEWV